MPRARKYKGEETKEAPAVGTAETSGADVNFQDDNSTESQDCQGKAWDGEAMLDIADGEKGRNFGYVVYPSEKWMRANYPECKYDGRDGWGTAPDNWIEQLTETGLPFAVSPLHWLDAYLDAATGEWIAKKPHWHLIISWGNSTTYRSAAAITERILHGPRPIILRQPVGYYRYFNHLDNPEKHQYEDAPTAYNGWERPITGSETTRIMRELTAMVFERDCAEYAELVIEAIAEGPEYQQVAERQTMYLSRICDGYRWSPVRVLNRYVARMPGLDPEMVCRITELAAQKQAAIDAAERARRDGRREE